MKILIYTTFKASKRKVQRERETDRPKERERGGRMRTVSCTRRNPFGPIFDAH